MPKVRRKLMDKELDKMEFKLNGLSALYRVQTRREVWSPLYLNTLEAFQKWNRFHRQTHKSTKLSWLHKVPTGMHKLLLLTRFHGIFPWSMFTHSVFMATELNKVCFPIISFQAFLITLSLPFTLTPTGKYLRVKEGREEAGLTDSNKRQSFGVNN